jgi:arsenate reductase
LYLEANLKKSDIKNVIRILNISPRDLLRKSEEAYKINDLKNESYTNDQLIDFMIKYPKLIERPIIIKGDQAVIGRPPEKVFDLIK